MRHPTLEGKEAYWEDDEYNIEFIEPVWDGMAYHKHGDIRNVVQQSKKEKLSSRRWSM